MPSSVMRATIRSRHALGSIATSAPVDVKNEHAVRDRRATSTDCPGCRVLTPGSTQTKVPSRLDMDEGLRAADLGKRNVPARLTDCGHAVPMRAKSPRKPSL